jgi:hypothetical protein
MAEIHYEKKSDEREDMAAGICKEVQSVLRPDGINAMLAKAAATFCQEHPGATHHHAKYLATATWERMLNGCQMQDAPRSGRPVLAPDKIVKILLERFLQGNGLHGDEWWGFTSLHHALEEDIGMRTLMLQSGIQEKQLWARMQRVHQQVHHSPMKTIYILQKPKLSQEVKQERLATANQWKMWGKQELLHVVWIDEKQEWLTKAGRKYTCYAPVHTSSITRESEQPLSTKFKIKYNAAVSAFGGALFLKFITGTTGFTEEWQVCIPLFQLGDTLTQPPALRARHAASRTCILMSASLNDIRSTLYPFWAAWMLVALSLSRCPWLRAIQGRCWLPPQNTHNPRLIASGSALGDPSQMSTSTLLLAAGAGRCIQGLSSCKNSLCCPATSCSLRSRSSFSSPWDSLRTGRREPFALAMSTQSSCVLHTLHVTTTSCVTERGMSMRWCTWPARQCSIRNRYCLLCSDTFGMPSPSASTIVLLTRSTSR